MSYERKLAFFWRNLYPSNDEHKLYLHFIAITIICFCWRIFISEEYRGNGVFFQDDFYYYIVVANNFWNYGFLTFDGLVETSGFQPLWQYCVVVLSYFLDKSIIVEGVLVLNLAMVLLFIGQSRKLLLELELPLLALYLSIIALVTLPTLGQFLFNGMETALEALLIVVAIRLFLKIGNQPEHRFGFGLFTGLAMLARLDSFVFFIPFYAYLLVRSRKTFFISSILHLMVVVPYLLYMLQTTGHMVPVSGLAKQFYGNEASYSGYSNILYDSLPFLKYSFIGASAYLLKSYLSNIYALAVFMAVWSIGYLRLIYITVPKVSDTYFDLLVMRKILFISVILFVLFQVVYYNLFSIGLDTWIFGFSGLSLLYLTFLPLGGFIDSVIANIVKRKLINIFFLILITPVLLSFPVYSHKRHVSDNINHGGEFNQYAEAANWLNKNLDKNKIVASWAAGQLGFLTNNRMVQLEGLVNNNDYLDVLKKGLLKEYTCKKEIEYILLNVHSDREYAEFDGVDYIASRSAITKYRGKYIREMLPYLQIEWVSAVTHPPHDKNRMAYFVIYSVNLPELCYVNKS